MYYEDKIELVIENLISTYRNKPYTLEHILRKGFIRSSLICEEIIITEIFQTMYGDKDYKIFVKNFECSRPEFGTGSPWFVINGYIPVHVTAGGKRSWGFGCNNWENPNDDYKHEYWKSFLPALKVEVFVEDNDYHPQLVYETDNVVINEHIEGETIIELLKEVIARRTLKFASHA